MELYVSSKMGNDLNSGSKESPFKSVAKAYAELLKLVHEGNVKEITVIISEGTYFLDDALHFGYDDVKDVKITFKGEEGCLPRLVAGKPVENWEPYTDKIYKAKLDRKINMIYEDFKLCRKSRLPKEGYYRVSQMDADSLRCFYSSETENIQLDEDSQVSIWPGGKGGEWNWFNVIVDVEKKQGSKITLGAEVCYDMGVGTRFFFQNSFSMLTEPGEFYLDEKNYELYYYPIKPLGESIIIAPTSKRVISAVGNEDAYIENLTFENLEMCCSDAQREFIAVRSEEEVIHDGLIYLENCRNIMVKDCKIHDTGIHAVLIEGRNDGHRITGNEIYDIGHTGVQIQGPVISNKNINVNHLVANNHIHHLGKIIGHGAGVQMLQSGFNRVEHNYIHHSRRYCISGKSTPYLTVQEAYPGQEVEDLESYKLARGNLIYANEMHDANKDSQDTGVVEVFECLQNRISKNIIRDSNIPFSFGFGIYLDGPNEDTVVDNNIIYNLQKEGNGVLSCVIQVKAVRGKVFNNIVADNTRLCNSNFGMITLDKTIDDNVISTNNIFYRSSSVMYSFFDHWADKKVKISENNIAYNDGAEIFIDGMFGVQTNRNILDWQEIFNNKYDQFTVTADPQFAGKNDYRLKYTSYAFALGTKQIDISDIGLLDSFKFPYANDTRGKIYVNGSTTYLDLKSDKISELKISYRTGNGFLRTLSLADVDSEIENPEIAELCGGGIKGKQKGMTRLKLSYDGVTDVLDVLVDDELKELSIITSKKTAAVGDAFKYKVIGRTEFGKYLSDLSDIKLSCTDGIHFDSEYIYTDATGKNKIEVVSPIAAETDINVVDDVFTTLECNIEKPILKVGESASVDVRCITQKQKVVEYEDLKLTSSDTDVFVIEDNRIKAVGVGEANITVIAVVGGVEKKNALPVCAYDGKEIEGYEIINFKNAKGVFYKDSESEIHCITRSANIWYGEDEATFLAKKVSADKKITIMADLVDLTPSHGSSQAGLLIKAGNAPGARMINLRMTKGGGVNMHPPEIMMCCRLADNEQISGGGGGGVGAYPVTLRLEFENNKVKGSYRVDKDWIHVAKEDFTCDSDLYCGLAMFSVNTEKESSAIYKNFKIICE